MRKPRRHLVFLPLGIAAAVLRLQPSQAAPPQQRSQATGRITVHFQLSHGASGAATLTDSIHLIKGPDQYSGCGIESIPSLHATELLIQIWPHSAADFLTKRFKLTVSLTKSGGVVMQPVPPTVVLGFNQELYDVISVSGTPHVTLHNGGRRGTFDIPYLTAANEQTNKIRIKGSWSCNSVLHVTSVS